MLSTMNGGSTENRRAAEAAKRALDFTAASLVLLCSAPLLLAIAVLVKLSSPGPVLFRQERVGRGGKLFWLYKFRSMRPDSGGPAVTAGGDSRVTWIGKLLRRSKLDELPQFFNVVRGEMSLVGPRPEVPRYVAHYSEVQRGVLSVRPGITGVTQLRFRDEEGLLAGRDDVESFYINSVMPAKLASDLEYVRSWSVAGDVRLLFATVAVLLPGGKGSAPCLIEGQNGGSSADLTKDASNRARRV